MTRDASDTLHYFLSALSIPIDSIIEKLRQDPSINPFMDLTKRKEDDMEKLRQHPYKSIDEQKINADLERIILKLGEEVQPYLRQFSQERLDAGNFSNHYNRLCSLAIIYLRMAGIRKYKNIFEFLADWKRGFNS